jgi:hypothetical protein
MLKIILEFQVKCMNNKYCHSLENKKEIIFVYDVLIYMVKHRG